MGKQQGLVKQLQMVQNKAVRVIAGAFCTTPREPLHQLLTILPMDVRLEMLTQNTALRLYRVAGDSQLLRRLGGAWLPAQPDDQPLPTPNSHTARTTLHALASQISAKGPCIQPFPDAPPDAPGWDSRVTCDPKQDKWDYQQATEALVALCKEGQSVNIFTTGAFSNRNQEDGTQLGAASAVLYHNGQDWRHRESILGESATEANVALKALSVALDLLSDFLTANRPTNPPRAMIATVSSFAINKVLNCSAHEEQNVSLECMNKIGELLDSFPNLNIQLLWLPRSAPFIGFKRAKQLALEAIHMADLAPDQEPHTIKHQKKKTKEAAIASWADHWHKALCTSLVYRTALTKPPDGQAHPTFKLDQSTAKFSHKTSCMLYHLATGHAFTGEYMRRFYSCHTQEQVACPCGELTQTVEHLLLKCPKYNIVRQKHLTANGHLRNLPQLFNHPKRVSTLLCFLQETGAGSMPRMEWEPG
jgi:hypothetical protein